MAEQQTITLKSLSSLCDITERRVQQLAKEGVMISAKARGEYLFPSSVNNYFKYLHQREKPSNVVDYNEHKSRKVKAEADRLERINRLEEREVIERAEAGKEISDACSVVAMILGNFKLNVARIAPEVPNRVLDLLEKENAKAMKAVCELDESYRVIAEK